MSQADLTSHRFRSEECQQHNQGRSRLISAADIHPDLRPTGTIRQERLEAIEAKAKSLVRHGGCSSVESTICGKVGEFVFYNLMPDVGEPDMKVRPEGDGGWDFESGNIRIDVKTAKEGTTNPDLLISEPLKADTYVLMNRIDQKTCELLGVAEKDNIMTHAKSVDYGHDYRLSQEDLDPITQDRQPLEHDVEVLKNKLEAHGQDSLSDAELGRLAREGLLNSD